MWKGAGTQEPGAELFKRMASRLRCPLLDMLQESCIEGNSHETSDMPLEESYTIRASLGYNAPHAA